MSRHSILFVLFSCLLMCTACAGPPASQSNVAGEPYLLSSGLASRAITFENPTGAKGAGGQTENHLGVGRKGAPNRRFQPGETVQLADIAGPGTIRHIWVTLGPRNPEILRSMVIRVYYNNQAHPSIESPIGDFMGFAHGKVMPYQSAAHSVGKRAGMNLWLPMPFTDRVRMTLTNERDIPVMVYYQIDYTIGDRHPRDVGVLHTLFRRENPTTMTQDFEILPQRTGRGRFMGTVLGIRSLDPHWWGEGEMKAYIDGDTDFPTICGTGSEDYVGLSYGMQQTPFLYNGCSLNQNAFISMYRWHHLNPIVWEEDIRITIQQIGYDRERENHLYERQDDWSAATFWYEPAPSAPLPVFPDQSVRLADIWQNPPRGDQ